jgi:drug/metabolite transporter (DMT)-like permease
MKNAPSAARLLAALATALVAVSSAALWIRMAHAGPLAISFYRLVYATTLLAPFAFGAARRELPAVPKRDRWLIVGAGVALAFHFAAWIASLAPSSPVATSVAASATLVAIHPALVAAATPWITGGPFPRRAVPGIALALVGSAVIAWGDRRGHHRLTGDLLAFLGAIAGAAYFVLGGRLRKTLGLMAYVLPVYAIAAATLGLLALATGESLRITDPREHLLFLVLALGPMILGHTLLNWALRYLPAWAVATTILAEPVASTALVFVVLRDVPPVTAVVGALLVLSGLGVIARGGRAT